MRKSEADKQKKNHNTPIQEERLSKFISNQTRRYEKPKENIYERKKSVSTFKNDKFNHTHKKKSHLKIRDSSLPLNTGYSKFL